MHDDSVISVQVLLYSFVRLSMTPCSSRSCMMRFIGRKQLKGTQIWSTFSSIKRTMQLIQLQELKSDLHSCKTDHVQCLRGFYTQTYPTASSQCSAVGWVWLHETRTRRRAISNSLSLDVAHPKSSKTLYRGYFAALEVTLWLLELKESHGAKLRMENSCPKMMRRRSQAS